MLENETIMGNDMGGKRQIEGKFGENANVKKRISVVIIGEPSISEKATQHSFNNFW